MKVEFNQYLCVFIVFVCFPVCNYIAEVNAHHSHMYEEKNQRYFELYNEGFASLKNCSSCECYSGVITQDLDSFKDGITMEMLELAYTKGTKYQVINHRVYRSSSCLFPSRCEGVDYFINAVRKQLPDIELAINCHDWPRISRHFSNPIPVFSFSKTKDFYDITYPAWGFWKGGPALKIYPTGIGRWDKQRLKMAEATDKWPWEKKKNIAFFRGSRTNSERDNLVLLSRKHPDLIDAQYTKNQAWKSDNDTLGRSPAQEVPFEDHCQYRYLFNFRGVAASFRLKYLFLCNSLVFHVGDEWKEFFYDALKPWVHYVPVSSEASQKELKELVEFFKNEDSLAQDIAQNGYTFIRDNLNMEDVICYWRLLLRQYSSLLKFKPKLDKTLIEVTD